MPNWVYIVLTLVMFGGLFGPQVLKFFKAQPKMEDDTLVVPELDDEEFCNLGRIDAIAHVERVRNWARENGYPQSLDLAMQLQASLCMEKRVENELE